MPGGLSFWVDKPAWLLLLLLIVPLVMLAWRSIRSDATGSRRKAVTALIVRSLVVALLAVAMAEPNWALKGEGLTTQLLIDRSDSIPIPLKKSSVELLTKAVELKENREDRVGVIEIARDAAITAMPDDLSKVGTPRDDGDLTATDLASGVAIAISLAPPDTANRFLLVSDGNETQGSAVEAAQLAKANGIPIDVLLLEYEHVNEVIFDRLIAPARARFGQPVTVKMVLSATSKASGVVSLMLNDEPLDLNGSSEEGHKLRLSIDPGAPTVIPVTVDLQQAGPQQFSAVFEPDEQAMDMIGQNNRGVAVTFVGSEGRVLVIEDGKAYSESLVTALKAAKIDVTRTGPDEMGNVLSLSGYDAVILANVPRWSIDDTQDRDLHDYVHDVGGGLMMVGGPQSFGAGGWIDSEVSKALPVKLDPPSVKQMQRGALVIIMHSCEMAQGNYWGEMVAAAAIEALSNHDYIGILDYDWNFAGGYNWAFKLQAGNKAGALAATKKMTNGDMPDFGTTMQMALAGLTSVNAGKRHSIIISDGDPSPPSQALLNQYIAAGVSLSTVMVGGHGTLVDANNMNDMATQTGGRYYNVKNPKMLPQIFIKEAKVVSRSLIVEGDQYQPQVVSRIPGPIESYGDFKPITGYVLTAPREGMFHVPVVVTGEVDKMPVSDPIYAYGNYGVGKSLAITTDMAGTWAASWVTWDQYRAFCEKSVRWVMRPSSPVNFTVGTRQEGDTAFVDVEALESDSSFLNFLKTSAVVLGPDGSREPMALQQVGPGKYRGEFKTREPGAYLVNIRYAGGTDESALEGSVQAAVAVPYSREYRSIKHNAALLEQIARDTGGEFYRASNMTPETLDLFNRGTLEVPKTPKRVWDLLAIIAAALFVFDVAVRRVSVDREALRDALAKAAGKRGQTKGQTVAAWKKARSQVAHRQPPEQADRKAKFEASAEDSAKAIDVGAEHSDVPRADQSQSLRKPEEAPKDDGDYTSRLLKAKRRAQGQGDDKPGDGAANG